MRTAIVSGFHGFLFRPNKFSVISDVPGFTIDAVNCFQVMLPNKTIDDCSTPLSVKSFVGLSSNQGYKEKNVDATGRNYCWVGIASTYMGQLYINGELVVLVSILVNTK